MSKFQRKGLVWGEMVMRLVDVDELIEYFDGDLEGYDNREYILHMLDSKGRSARVEAIPIEWIKNWIIDRNDWPTMPYNDHIWHMLDDWREENER